MIFKYGKLHDPLLPKDIRDEIVRVGGRHPLYGTPLFRLIWGQKRLHWVGGKFENELDANGNRLPVHVATKLEPRYLGKRGEQWILERWIGPACTKEAWTEQNGKSIDGVWVDQLGPYPLRGDYEEVITFPAEVASTPELLRLTIMAVKLTQEVSHSVRKAAASARQDKRDRDWDTDADAMLNDTPISYLRPSVVVPTTYKGA